MNLDLVRAARERRIILFVGAGVSQTLGLPSFRQLIRHLAEQLDFDPDIFQTHGDYLALAEYYMVEKSHIGSLRSWLDKEWHADRNIGDSDIHRFIVELNFPIIYTTNYDSWLELAFKYHKKDYVKVVNVGDLAQTNDRTTQIIKFHGDFEDDSSIILSETSYFERLNFESPLDIKLRSDLLGRSILFIGYSLQDINIRLMLFRLMRQWTGFEKHRPKSFIFLTRPNPVQETILRSRGIEPVVSDFDDPKKGLAHFLEELLRESQGRGAP
ncbi:SIR2 family protein [bacterium]|nr:SIR2 family protein [bacterium]